MDAEDKEKLRSYFAVIDDVIRDIDQYYRDGFMSDVKASVHAMPRKIQALGLSDAAVEAELVALAKDCWDAMYHSDDDRSDSEARAGRAAAATGVLERRIRALLGEAPA